MYSLFDKLTFNIIAASVRSEPSTESLTTKINYVNPCASKLLGYEPGQVLDKSLNDISAANWQSEFWSNTLSNALTSIESSAIECQLLDSNNAALFVSLQISVLPEVDELNREFLIIFEDISSKKQADKSLAMMSVAVEQSASAVLITDPQGCIEYVNPKFVQMTGYTAAELIGHNPKIFQSGETRTEQYQSLWSNLKETGEWHGEIKNQRKDGQYYWVNESISTIKNSHGETTHILAVEEDITEQKKITFALTESEQRFHQMADMTGEWLWEQDPEGFYIYSSAAVINILGIKPSHIIGQRYIDLLTPQDQTLLSAQAKLDRPFYAIINHYRHEDGHSVITESTGLPITDTAGKVIKWRGVDRDITARKHFEDALLNSEKRNRLIIDSALNAIVIMDAYGIVTDWNPQAEKMFGWTAAEAIGARLAELIIPERFRKAHQHGLDNFLRNGKGLLLNKLIEQTALHRDGSEFPVELSIAPLKRGNGYVFSGFIHDISARKQAEKNIRQAQINLAIAHNEFKIARDIQSSLFPPPSIKTKQYEVMGYCLPADQVGGDYYDYFYRDKNNLDMVIADVSGHSIGPALFMVEARSVLRAQANWPGTPAETLTILNNSLHEDLYNADFFITLFYLQFHIETEQLRYANAGHPPALHYHFNQGHCSQLDADGLIIGIRREVEFEQKTIAIEQGDMVLLYTDGIIEAENPEGEFFGQNRLSCCFKDKAHLSPKNIIDHILSQLKTFCQCSHYQDDITLIIFKRSV